MGFSVFLPLAIWAAVAQTQVTPTKGQPFPAQVLAITASEVELAEGNKLSQRSVAQLRRLSFGDPREPQPANPAGDNSAQQATLIDGSAFHFDEFTLANETAQFALAAGTSLTVAAEKLHRVQLQTLSTAQWTQWQAIAQSRTSADMLVLIRSAEALEKLEGIVSQVTATAASFNFSGQDIDAPLTKLAGIRFFTDSATGTSGPAVAATSDDKLAAIVLDRQGNRWLAAELTLPRGGSNLQIRLQCGATLALPLSQLREIDFSSGSMQFLAELDPLVHETSGRFDLAVDIAGTDQLFGARAMDVRQPGSPRLGPSLQFLGSGAVEYRVPADFTRLQGAVELRPSGSRFTPCKVVVKLENEVLWQQRLSETGQLRPLDVEIKPDGRLRIEVVADAPTPVGDVVLWHELRFIK